MSHELLRSHAAALQDNAKETAGRAAASPEDWLLQIAAKNQTAAAIELARELAISDAGEQLDAIEWRLVGQRLKFGEVPLSLLARLADPLNKLFLRAAYFARNHIDPPQGGSGDLSSELDLRLIAVAAGSARLFIRGNSLPDTTGKSALRDGVENLFSALSAANDFTTFYERLGGIGESAARSLRDTLHAIEQEECSMELRWHSPNGSHHWAATYDNVVRIRALLDGTTEPSYRQSVARGAISLLAVNGRLQLIAATGQKLTVRFDPKLQTAQVAELHLGQPVELSVTERIVLDPITGDERTQYKLNPPANVVH